MINAAGIIDIHHQQVDSSAAKMKAHIEMIGTTLKDIFTLSQAQQRPTNIVANELAEAKFK